MQELKDEVLEEEKQITESKESTTTAATTSTTATTTTSSATTTTTTSEPTIEAATMRESLQRYSPMSFRPPVQTPKYQSEQPKNAQASSRDSEDQYRLQHQQQQQQQHQSSSSRPRRPPGFKYSRNS